MGVFTVRNIGIKIAAIFALLAPFGCSQDRGGFLDRFLKGGGSTVPVTIENVLVRDRAYEIKVPATLRAAEEVNITVPEEVTLKQVLVAKNDPVEEGNAIFQVAERETASLVNKYRDDLKDAKAELEKNTYLIRNRDRLLDEGRLDQNQYDGLDAEIETNEARIERLQAEISRLKDQTGNVNITSPISGVVSSINGAVGTTVAPGKTIATITKVNPILAVFELESYESSTVRPGMAVNVKLPDLSGESLKAEIAKVDPTLDPESKTFKVYASVPNQKGYLKVGMPAEVQFTSSQKQRFYLIPAEALIREHRRYFVFTVINGVAHKVEVVPKEKKGGRIEIAKGLREDDIVVVKGNDKLTEGTVVDIWGR